MLPDRLRLRRQLLRRRPETERLLHRRRDAEQPQPSGGSTR